MIVKTSDGQKWVDVSWNLKLWDRAMQHEQEILLKKEGGLRFVITKEAYVGMARSIPL